MANTRHAGLYRPEYEHDACGVGFLAHLDGQPRHSILRDALQVLCNLEHRGACGCDPESGDGAGILMQLPHEFLTAVAAAEGIELPEPEHYGVGMLFLPGKEDEARRVVEIVESLIKDEDQQVLGWRDVPVDSEKIGKLARETEPRVKQVFIGRSRGLATEEDFERLLFVIRKQIWVRVRATRMEQKKWYHAASFSARTLIYKGMLLARQVDQYYPDLCDERMKSALALVHQRYSTNTFPKWDLAQPFRYLAHNGEINTLRGNINWMHARESLMETDRIPRIDRLFPIIPSGQSDSACLDNALELLYQTGRNLPQCASMLIPEPWQNHESMSEEKKAYYEYHSCLMEPWDGPASIAFTNGRMIGATLDRNGLRPSRYWVTKDGLVVMASEAGVLEIPQHEIKLKGRLQPGRMFLCDLAEHRIVSDEEIKRRLAQRRPYGQWLEQQMLRLEDLPAPEDQNGYYAQPAASLNALQRAFGYTIEDLRVLLAPMATGGKEPTGSMGNDTALAVLSDRPRLLYDYFKQLFAQVTNPPLDAIREELVTSLVTTLGSEGNLFEETPEQAHMVRVDSPVLTRDQFEKLRQLNSGKLRSETLPILFERAEGEEGLRRAMDELCTAASEAIERGVSILILSDRGISHDRPAIPALLAVAGVHHHLIREGTRTRCGIVLESGEPREVQHFCLLSGYGCGAYYPYVALETLEELRREGELGELTEEQVIHNFRHAVDHGILKVMSKMGISTLHSYRGAQIFEAVGLNSELIDRYFTWTASRIQGVGLETLARETLMRHGDGFSERGLHRHLPLEMGGQYHWRRNGERHMINPFTVATLQESTQLNSVEKFQEFCRLVDEDARTRCTLRGLLRLRTNETEAIPLEEVEPAAEIVKRFKTGAMSYGSISKEAHETLAIAMNRLGGKSNTGEGGEDPVRFTPDANGDSRCSKIKQVASGRFGVTIHYLVNSEEIQIKMAQGAKPGEGGALAGLKVDKTIARVRHSTPGVGLISPPPHHDIYSIEDMSQLIHDLKNANPQARINVKLVSEVGVGTIAAGVSKGKADVVLISGHDGGTGNSPLSSIKHAGLPWELGLAETHQTLVLNDLRSRIVVETDGQLKTGRDVAIGILLGGEEFGFSTAPLISIGCIMMRKCHLNTCPVGIATQDPELRKKFAGKPEHVVNYFFLVAEEVRKIMAKLGIRTVNEMVGRADLLDVNEAVRHWKSMGVDLSPILYHQEPAPGVGTYCSEAQDHGLEAALDNELIARAAPALERGEKVTFESPIRNINRTACTMLSSEIAKRYGGEMLPEDTIHIKFTGSAGQSFGAFGARGLTMEVVGDANDYFGKGLSGGRMIIYPAKEATFAAEENIIIGNVAFYGATMGEAYIRGMAGERFCVRNSGVEAVVEGVGDHACEYMTGGRAIVLGGTGRNFAAGMSGGIAYVLDETADFAAHCNQEMVDLERVEEASEAEWLRGKIEKHRELTGSVVAEHLLGRWEATLPKFVKVMPRDYKRALAELKAEAEGTAVGAAN